MLGKILFTAAIIFGAFALLRFRQSRLTQLPPQAALRVLSPETKKKTFSVGWLASVAVVLMLLSTGLVLFSFWQDANEVVFIRIVDAGSGKSVEYQAFRSDIESRSFKTRDGVRIVLADTERLETSTQPRK